MSERAEKVQAIAKILRSAIFQQGKHWLQAAEDVLDTLEAETEYEYNIERTSGVSGKTSMCYGDDGWDSDLEVVKEDIRVYFDGETATKLGATYRIVKRRKAGEIEDV